MEKKRIVPLVWVSVIFGFATIILPVVIYYCSFANTISIDIEDWIDFTNYYSGVTSPLLTFFSVLLLVLTLNQQRKESTEIEKRYETETSRQKQIDLVQRLLFLIEYKDKKVVILENDAFSKAQDYVDEFLQYFRMYPIEVHRLASQIGSRLFPEDEAKRFYHDGVSLKERLDNLPSKVKDILVINAIIYETLHELNDPDEVTKNLAVVRASYSDVEKNLMVALGSYLNLGIKDIEQFGKEILLLNGTYVTRPLNVQEEIYTDCKVLDEIRDRLYPYDEED